MTAILQTVEQEAAACRAAWAAAPDATLAHGLHYGQHYEELFEPAENRIAYILTHKPEVQRPICLRYFRPCDEPMSAQWRAARTKWWTAGGVWAIGADWHDVYRQFIDAPEVIAEHDRLFPGCPWDGYTFFPANKVKAPVKW